MGIIRTREYFFIGSTKSTSVGLNVESLQPPAMASQRYTQWSNGKDVDFVSNDDTFDDVQYDIEARLLRAPDKYDSADVYALFANARTLSLSVIPGYYYKIHKVLSITPSADSAYRGNEIRYLISLQLAPFKYHIDNTEQTITGGTITNPGTRYSRPVYKITGRTSGNTTTKLTVNGQQLTLSELTDASTTIYIDTERMLIYDQANTNLMEKSSGILPFLAPGVNTAAVTAGTLSITGNWRSY